MAGREIEVGPVGRRVGANVGQVRREQGMTQVELAKKLDDLGRRIPPQGLARLEAGERRVDVDDLVVLAACLGVSVESLLAPTLSERERDVFLAVGNWWASHDGYQRVLTGRVEGAVTGTTWARAQVEATVHPQPAEARGEVPTPHVRVGRHDERALADVRTLFDADGEPLPPALSGAKTHAELDRAAVSGAALAEGRADSNMPVTRGELTSAVTALLAEVRDVRRQLEARLEKREEDR